MINKDEIRSALDGMILSASGWRGVFGADDESKTDQIGEAHRVIAAAAAYVFAEYLFSLGKSGRAVLLGTDTRPTGKAIANAMIPVLLASCYDVCYAGVIAAPEIMAWARSFSMETGQTLPTEKKAGFIYISASHNPIGHNGIKFGLTDGGVLAAEEAVKLIANFRAFLDRDYCIEKMNALTSWVDPGLVNSIISNTAVKKSEAYKAYFNFCKEVVFPAFHVDRPLGVVCDFNGSARTVSIDAEFFASFGLVFDCINVVPGEIAHRIVPEGESLEPCRLLLEKAHARDASFLLGYTPDCDGDRGNLVIWDDAIGKARSLEAQEVFALACVAELSHLVRTGELAYDENGRALCKAAVAVNDPTSMRIDRIADAFDVSVFRAEVGEANVVALARRLRKEGYIVRILGEGSAGGNITHPSAVRDPVHTVLALVKLISIGGQRGFFKIWCERSGQAEKYRDDFTLSDVIASLPQFVSTPAYSDKAVMRINTKDHALLKDRYKKVFLREWEERKDELGFCRWEAAAYNGLEEKRNIAMFGEAGKGGLKIRFFTKEGKEAAFIWMRGSATEPVFRIMADVEGDDKQGNEKEQLLLNWQRSMIEEADRLYKE